MSDPNQFLLYTAPDGAVKVEVFFKDETVWLTQKALAELFGVKVPAINKHLKNIFESSELTREATVSKMEIVRSEGDREVAREVEFYNLGAIIAVGYRVNSCLTTLFNEWHAVPAKSPSQPPSARSCGWARFRRFPSGRSRGRCPLARRTRGLRIRASRRRRTGRFSFRRVAPGRSSNHRGG
ncbi:MAG: virulence RhuM family protein [Verrucomicrobia bacterium]|nr:virulence RhuM family protein [Verrucomicrobiota bacterium]